MSSDKHTMNTLEQLLSQSGPTDQTDFWFDLATIGSSFACLMLLAVGALLLWDFILVAVGYRIPHHNYGEFDELDEIDNLDFSKRQEVYEKFKKKRVKERSIWIAIWVVATTATGIFGSQAFIQTPEEQAAAQQAAQFEVQREQSIRALLAEALIAPGTQTVELAKNVNHLFGDSTIETTLKLSTAGQNSSSSEKADSHLMSTDVAATQWAQSLVDDQHLPVVVTYDDGRREILESSTTAQGDLTLVKPLDGLME